MAGAKKGSVSRLFIENFQCLELVVMDLFFVEKNHGEHQQQTPIGRQIRKIRFGL